ncbi:hypothetical protein [Rhizobium aegyptiacum]|uniref:hypothetical protein n=1 Tax=Rhizobium aegyptiacum TaxID=1764550 RepID=UPI0007E546CB|nr:hypothetical protein [Rhizobium aegyptiacum]
MHRDQINQLRGLQRIRSFNLALDKLLHPRADARLASGLLGSMCYDAVVSNLGRASMLERVGDVELESVWGPVGQARLKEERFVGVVTAADALRLIEARPTRQPSLLDPLVNNLIDFSMK